MRTDDLDYELPKELIAQLPIEPRDAARLLVPGGVSLLTGGPSDAGPTRGSAASELCSRVAHAQVRDLASFLEPGDLLVVNNTKVLPARVPVVRDSGGSGEILLLEDRGDGWWESLCKPSRKLPVGSTVESAGGRLTFEMGADLGDGRRMVRPVPEEPAGLGHDESALMAMLDTEGEMPLPPYIHEQLDDPQRYQTTFAQRPASAAAPTAGLHLTPGLLGSLHDLGVRMAKVELVVGLDTFRPVTTEHIEEHPIHTEHYHVPESTWHEIGATRLHGGRVVAVGTTTTRALESVTHSGDLSGRTELFITPGFEFRVVDMMMTNFHLPRSSLLAMVEAFTGPQWRDLYSLAIEQRYRFLSFGDAMLLTRSLVGPRSAASGIPDP